MARVSSYIEGLLKKAEREAATPMTISFAKVILLSFLLFLSSW
jgi:hypothetical protein